MRRSLFTLPWAGLLVVCASALASCTGSAADSPRRTIRIVTGDPHGAYHALGETVASLYTERVPGIRAAAVPAPTVALGVASLQEGSAELAFTSAGSAYSAYRTGSADSRALVQLRGIAVLYTSAYQFIVREDSPLKAIGDLKGKRVGVVLTSTDPRARIPRVDIIIEAYGLTMADVQVERMTIAEVPDALSTRRVDCVLVPAGFPDPALVQVAGDIGIRMLEVSEQAAARVRAQVPFFKPVIVPRGTYPAQRDFVRTIGFQNYLLCAETLDEDLVYQLTKAFFAGLPDMARIHGIVRNVDPELASATLIPLHPGAARYYREWQLVK